MSKPMYTIYVSPLFRRHISPFRGSSEKLKDVLEDFIRLQHFAIYEGWTKSQGELDWSDREKLKKYCLARAEVMRISPARELPIKEVGGLAQMLNQRVYCPLTHGDIEKAKRLLVKLLPKIDADMKDYMEHTQKLYSGIRPEMISVAGYKRWKRFIKRRGI